MKNGDTYTTKRGARTTVTSVYLHEAPNGSRFLMGKVYSTDGVNGWEGWMSQSDWTRTRAIHEAR